MQLKQYNHNDIDINDNVKAITILLKQNRMSYFSSLQVKNAITRDV